MRETVSQIKEKIRKQVGTRDKLVVLLKAPNGQIVEVLDGQWVEVNFLEELRKQATLNKQEYENALKVEATAKEELLTNRFILLAKEYEALVAEHKALLERTEALAKEIRIIKGEEVEVAE